MEFALVLPLLMLLLFGIISYGLYINANVTLQEAARIGARTLALGDPLGCPGQSAAQAMANSSNAYPVTVYGVVDDQINNGFGMNITANGSPSPVLTLDAGGTYTTVWEYQTGSASSSQQTYGTVEVFYVYHPIIPIPGLLGSTVVLHQTYSMMVETPEPESDLSAQPTPTPSGYNAPSGSLVVNQPGGCTP